MSFLLYCHKLELSNAIKSPKWIDSFMRRCLVILLFFPKCESDVLLTCIVHINISLSTIVLPYVNKLTGYNPLSIQTNLLSHLRNRGQWVGGRWSLSINSRNRLCMILVRVLFVVTSLRFFFVPIFAKCITNVHYVKVHYDGVWKLTWCVCSLHCVAVTIFSVQLSA